MEWTKCTNTFSEDKWVMFVWNWLMTSTYGKKLCVFWFKMQSEQWVDSNKFNLSNIFWMCQLCPAIHLQNVPSVEQRWKVFAGERAHQCSALQCFAIACQWRPNEGREGISYESPRNQFNHVAAHYRKLFTVAINDKCAFIPCLGPAANQIMAILDKLNCRQAICQSANILQV